MPTPWSYDAIAEVYATDMGQSMPFDDVGWYRTLALQRAGATLELGCGTGRILLELLAAGVQAIGMDRSLPMLRRLQREARPRALAPRLVQGDLADLPFAPAARFATILLPYSLITYVLARDAAVDLLRRLAALLEPQGLIVLDAFVPQAVASFSDFRLDYRRPHGRDTLQREKRIDARADGCNRIERRYRLLDAAGRELQSFTTTETIRPYAPDALRDLAARAGCRIERVAWDYDQGGSATGARFASLLLRAGH